MAVYTHVDQASLEDYLTQYSIGQLLDFQPIAEGVENSNYLLRTTQDRFILTLFEQRVAPQDLPFFLELKKHLHRQGIPCPLPISRNDGSALGQLCGRPATIVSFLQGKSLTSPSEDQCEQVGRLLGQLHQAAQGFSMTRVNGLAIDAWRPLFLRSASRADEVVAGLGDLLENELTFLENHWPDNLPTGVAHADLFRDNVFFSEGQLSGVIDFYFACNDLLAYDLAITLNAWCFVKNDGTFTWDHRRGERLLQGYLASRSLTDTEQANFSVLCRGAAVRFLLTRLHDWLYVPEGALTVPHDPKEYLQKLQFHQSNQQWLLA